MNNNIWFIICDIWLIIFNIYFVINKTGHWQFNLVAAICLTISASLLAAQEIKRRKDKK